MAVEGFANSPVTIVTAGGTDAPAAFTQETWTVQSSALFPPASTTTTPPTQFHIVDTALPSEIIAVVGVSGTTWTVLRGAEGTTPVVHAAGFTVFQIVTAGWLTPAAAQLAAPPGDGTGTKMMIPMYIYPTWFTAGGGAWQQVQSSAPATSIVVANPSSGPGTASNSDYATQIPLAKAAGLKVLGYVPTGHGTVPTATATGQVDNWYSWYNVDGIFFDEMTTAAGTAQTACQTLYNYVKGKLSGQGIVAINPGAIPDQTYMTACDIVCDFEGPGTTFTTSFTPATWAADYSANRFCRIVNTMTGATLGPVMSQMRTQRTGYGFITTNNLYNTLPADPYWASQVWQGSHITPANVPYPSWGIQGDTAQAIATGGTITSTGLGVARVSPSSSVTGIILQQGTAASQQLTVINEATASTVTFATAGTSFVADGATSAIAANAARTFVWDPPKTLWYRQG